MDKALLFLNLLLGMITISAVVYNIIKTHVLTYNHLAHLEENVKKICQKLDAIDKAQVQQGKEIVSIRTTCRERGKQLEILQSKD